ncbi:AMP-binding protein [Bacillus sp. REN10]|uniref:class I adenylate-forming enzyme family protein n=1 Tax=Bacillus sp. REN10 TaxID=2782541 RepID=UPI00193B197B|nr:AMP-binding protein [Bacillus sp. REN10]
MMLLTTILKENIEKFGEHDFIRFGDSTYTNIELDHLSTKLANYLQTKVKSQSDKVIVYLQNCPEVLVAYQAILKAGAVVVPVMYALNANEVHYIMENSDADTIITSSSLYDNIVTVAQKMDKKIHVIVTDAFENGHVERNMEVHELNQIYFSSEDKLIENNLNVKEDDLAVILYTSGTTSQPKGVMLTHRNLYISAQASANVMEVEMLRKTTVVALPLAHSFGFTAMNMYLNLGSTVIVLERFDAEEIFKAVEKYKIQSFSAVPAMIYGMIMHPSIDNYDFSSVVGILCSSAPLPIALSEAFTRKTGVPIWQGYGLSEAAPVVSLQWRDMVQKTRSVGPPIDIVEAKVIDEDGNTLPTGEIGELAVKGLNVTPGYYRLEEETARTIVDGWLRTGDIAYMDEDDYIFIVDRKKDMVIRGGLNIFPRDIEEVIVMHSDVLEVAAVGVPDEQMGECLVAYVVKKPDASITAEEIIAFSQEHLAKYKTPKEVIFIDQLPRNGVGKILKRGLVDIYQKEVTNR